MAFTDPQTVTIAGTPFTLPRVSVDDDGAKYLSSDGLIALSASHSYGKRTRRVLRVDHSKVTSDPFIPAQNVKVGMSFYLVFDIPPAGYTNTQVKDVYVGLNTLHTATSHALIDKLLGGES